ncbi:unnamed protein product [Cuscuta europaea]|uniref:B-like cyclin n=1 Tax=Cuscuta europaea TaxID=41803 RepID=A0A9P0YVD3_CUSEU|nr:unnamed protein product [Cuscuta europaea]
MRHANVQNVGGQSMRITRSRAKTFASSDGLPPLHPSGIENGKQVQRASCKRAASDENIPPSGAPSYVQPKKRAALRNVTNVVCDSSYLNCMAGTKVQDKKIPHKKNAKVIPGVLGQKRPHVTDDMQESTTEEPNKLKVEKSECSSYTNCKKNASLQQNNRATIGQSRVCGVMQLVKCNSKTVPQPSTPQIDDGKMCPKINDLASLGITDIDTNHMDPQMCTLYAADIYANLHANELDRRPSVDYMEKLQRDITEGMRGILIDWLVEVSEEYKLVPDTLYLTVNLIDRFLSENYIEKRKLQLLGVTCMLIASKYEEICAPRVEEFCCITDNTYSREEKMVVSIEHNGGIIHASKECSMKLCVFHLKTCVMSKGSFTWQVLKMESHVLNLLDFQLSTPTTKKFLRRFVQAAQTSYQVPSVELEFMANYLAELTLVDYSFLKILPSLIAASAVFLARWTLDQSEHPWNPTLEHYTRYKALELKTTVSALQDLQLNTKGSSLNAIHEKYKLPQFKCVATLTSPKADESLF